MIEISTDYSSNLANPRTPIIPTKISQRSRDMLNDF